MEDILKLYLVTLRGMTTSTSGSIAYGKSYVVAKDSNEAYLKVKLYLDDKDIGYTSSRELHSVELIADNYEYTNVGHLLFF